MKLRYAMVCSSNRIGAWKLIVCSKGKALMFRIMGLDPIREPNAYTFVAKTPSYKRNGILAKLKRNLSVKLAPQCWQDNAFDGAFDVVFTFEEKVFDMIVEDLNNRDQALMKPVLIINLEVKDNHEEAAIAARLILDLCQELETTESGREESVDDMISAFERHHRRKIYYISFY